MNKFLSFKKRFKFSSEYVGFVGVERECFLTMDGVIVPIANVVVSAFADPVHFGFELSACQLEMRTSPSRIEDLHKELSVHEEKMIQMGRQLEFERLHFEVGPEDMSLAVYPEPRYQRISATLSQEVLSAACRVIGTHVHIGMPNHEIALKVYNSVIGKVDELCMIGDGSFGKRLDLYRLMAPQWRPVRYENWEHFFEAAQKEGFDEDPRRCWTLIRISPHGTIEFRMFGSTDSLEKVICWAETCHQICIDAMT